MAGVRDPRHDVAPAVGHRATKEFRAIRRTPLTHRRVDGCRPLVHAIGIWVGDDGAAQRLRRSVYVLLVDAVVRSHTLLELLLKRRHQELLEHCDVSVRFIGLRHGADHSQVRFCSSAGVVHRRLHQQVFVLGGRDLGRPRPGLANFDDQAAPCVNPSGVCTTCSKVDQPAMLPSANIFSAMGTNVFSVSSEYCAQFARGTWNWLTNVYTLGVGSICEIAAGTTTTANTTTSRPAIRFNIFLSP